MLSFFRRALGSWVVLGLLGILLVAFLVTGVGTPSGLSSLAGGGEDPNAVATVGNTHLSANDVYRRVQGQFNEAKRQQPDLTMAQLISAAGGLNSIVDQMATGKAMEAWAAKQGLVTSNRLVDAQIATIPAFAGPTGQFDERVMQGILGQQHMTLADLRDGLRGDLLRRQLLVPMTAGMQAPDGLVKPYAELMTMHRIGQVGLVPIEPAKIPAPSAADVAAWYKAHVAAYSLPERRVLRYVALSPETVPSTPPTDAEIAAQYKADADKYAASESRTLSQVVLPDEAKAKAFAAKVAGGTPFAAAAKDAGFAPADISLGKQTKAAFTTASSAAVADQVFAAKNGATVGPLKSALGYQIVHVDAVEQNAGKTLAAATPEIRDALAKKKQTEALSALSQKLEDAISDGGTFDDVVKANKLTVVTSPPVTATGTNPTDPNFKADPTLLGLLKAGFLAAPEDQPTVETVGPDHYALLSVGSVVPGAPVPFDQAREKATADLTNDRAARAAQTLAKSIVDKLNKGGDLNQALAAAGLKPALPANASQIQLAQLPPQQVPPALRVLFQLAPGKSSVAAGQGGFYVVHLDRVEAGDPAMAAPIAMRLKQELSGNVGGELIEQFARATRADIVVKRNPAAIAALQKQLLGQAPAGQ